jgi:hypothetical protein
MPGERTGVITMLSDAKCQEIWAYVHGQLADVDRLALEAQLRDNPELDRELQRARQLDRVLRERLADTVAAQADLEDRVLEAIEADGTQTVARRWWHARVFTGVLAAAALLLILVGTPFYLRGPVEWEAMQFEPLEYRGGPEHVSLRARHEADACFRAFQDAFASALDKGGLPPSAPRPVIAFFVRELPRGRLAIEVVVRAGRDSASVSYTAEIGTIEEFGATAAELAVEVMDGLAARQSVQDPIEQDGGGTR